MGGIISNNIIKWNFSIPEDAGSPTWSPYCGGREIYTKIKFSGTGEFNYDFNGAASDNTCLHDDVEYRELKKIYCRRCNRPLGSIETESTGK